MLRSAPAVSVREEGNQSPGQEEKLLAKGRTSRDLVFIFERQGAVHDETEKLLWSLLLPAAATLFHQKASAVAALGPDGPGPTRRQNKVAVENGPQRGSCLYICLQTETAQKTEVLKSDCAIEGSRRVIAF